MNWALVDWSSCQQVWTECSKVDTVCGCIGRPTKLFIGIIFIIIFLIYIYITPKGLVKEEKR
jgi:hypothetical protein